MIINADLGELEVNANLFAHGNSLVQFFQIESFESLIENFLVALQADHTLVPWCINMSNSAFISDG